MYVPVPGFCRSPILYLLWQRHPQQVETQPLLTTQSLHTMMLGASWSHIYREHRLLAETFEHCELDSMFLLCISTFYSITYSNCRLDQTRENSGTLNTTSYCHILQQCDLLDKRLFMYVYIYIHNTYMCVCVRLTVRICWRKLKHVLLSLVFKWFQHLQNAQTRGIPSLHWDWNWNLLQDLKRQAWHLRWKRWISVPIDRRN